MWADEARIRCLALAVTLILFVLSGTASFRIGGGWSWLDSGTGTLLTVGYGSLAPASALGTIGTTIFIILGPDAFALTVQQFGKYDLDKREQHIERFAARLDPEKLKPSINEKSPTDGA